MPLQPLQVKGLQGLSDLAAPLSPVFFPVGAGQQIFLYGHIREKGVILEQKPYLAFLGCQVNPFR